MCKWGISKEVEINGRIWLVDACIADQVQILVSRGVKTYGCCCGHGKGFEIDNIEHHFEAELMVAVESLQIIKQYRLNTSDVYEKTCWGITRNYVNVQLNCSFEDEY